MGLTGLAMHIPDGFLSVPVSVVLWIVSAAVIAYALRRVGNDLGERQVPLMGVLAAAIFAGQMLNFAVTGGTSGHLMGAAIATILLGPWAAILVLTSVAGVQALLFQDGGLLALGANIFNMGIVGAAVSYFAYRSVQQVARGQKWGTFAGGFITGWLSVFAASLGVALQLAVSGTSPANLSIPAMAGIHALIGIGEGLITVGALAFLYAVRPGLLRGTAAQTRGGPLAWVGGLVIAVALAVLSPLASSNPDGLEWVAQQNGFLQSAQRPSFELISGYIVPGIANEHLATIAAGIIGTLIVFGVAAAVAYSRRNRSTASG